MSQADQGQQEEEDLDQPLSTLSPRSLMLCPCIPHPDQGRKFLDCSNLTSPNLDGAGECQALKPGTQICLQDYYSTSPALTLVGVRCSPLLLTTAPLLAQASLHLQVGPVRPSGIWPLTTSSPCFPCLTPNPSPPMRLES